LDSRRSFTHSPSTPSEEASLLHPHRPRHARPETVNWGKWVRAGRRWRRGVERYVRPEEGEE